MRTVHSVQRRPPAADAGYEPGWVVTFEDSRNATGLTAHAFPDIALHWRAAEYGIDPADAETLLDVVLHEALFTLHPDDPTFLYNTDEDAARRAHLKRVTQAKADHGLNDPGALLRQIHEHHRSRIDLEAHRERRATVERQRTARVQALKEAGRG